MLPEIKSAGAATLILLCGQLFQPATAATRSDNAGLDPVLVEGSRAKLSELRRQIVLLEDRFLDRYNELNTVPDFEVRCGVEARLGTLLKGRSCRATYESKALQVEGQRAFEFRQFVQEQFMRGAPDPSSQGGPPDPSIVAIKLRQPEFQKNMLEITRRDAGLQDLLRERHEAQQAYAEIRRGLYRGEKARKGETAARPNSTVP